MVQDIAVGESIAELHLVVPDHGLPIGTPLVIFLQLKEPVAHFFDLAGAEAVFRQVTPPGLAIVDVKGAGSWLVRVDLLVTGEIQGLSLPGGFRPQFVPLLSAAVLFIVTHWVGLSLLALGLSLVLGQITGAIKVQSILDIPKDVGKGLGAVAVIAVVGLLLGLLDMFPTREGS